jgi:hypothetical protein
LPEEGAGFVWCQALQAIRQVGGVQFQVFLQNNRRGFTHKTGAFPCSSTGNSDQYNQHAHVAHGLIPRTARPIQLIAVCRGIRHNEQTR